MTADRLLTGTLAELCATAEPEHPDRLWVADPRMAQTNPLSVAYGACGPILLVTAAERYGLVEAGTTEPWVDWVLEKRPSAQTCPAGLYLGLAGIAYTLLDVGRTAQAEQLLAEVPEHPTAFTDPGILYGSAGWGLAALHIAARTGAARWLDLAVRAGDHLLGVAEGDVGSVRWRGADGVLYYGYGRGSAGIALFLAHLYRATGRVQFQEAASAGLDHDLAQRFESESGWLWGRYEGDDLVRPYWMEGSSGIGAAALRVARLLGEDRQELVDRIADDAYCTLALNPNQFQGLAGIGEFMLDLDRADDAAALTQAIELFAVDGPDGTVRWPGRLLDRTVADYATGAAGLGAYLLRQCRPGPRLLMDLDAPWSPQEDACPPRSTSSTPAATSATTS